MDLIGWVGRNTVGKFATDTFDAACQKLWNGIVSLLSWSFQVMDKIGTVDVNPQPGHPLGQVYPIMLWIGLAMALAFGFLSIAQFAIRQGHNAADMVSGFVKFVLAWVGMLSLIAALVVMANELATGVLKAGQLNSWGDVSGHASWLAAGAGKDVSPMLAVLIGVLFLLPAACAYLVFAVIRAAGIEIVAATVPILTAGLLWNRTSRWLGLAWQWLLTLIFLPVLLAITVLIGISIMSGVGSSGGLAAVGQLLVGSVTLAASLFCPLLLFKLFAFVPAGVAGQLDGVAPSFGGFGGRGASSSGSSSSSAGGMSPQDEVSQIHMGRMQAAAAAVGGIQGGVIGAGQKGADTLESVGVGHSTGQQSTDGAGSSSGGSSSSSGSSSSGSSSSGGSSSGTSSSGAGDVGSPAEPTAQNIGQTSGAGESAVPASPASSGGSSSPASSGGSSSPASPASSAGGGQGAGESAAPAEPVAPRGASAPEGPSAMPAASPAAAMPGGASAGQSSAPESSVPESSVPGPAVPVEGPVQGPAPSSAPVGEPAGGGQPGAGAGAGGEAAAGGAEAAAVIV